MGQATCRAVLGAGDLELAAVVARSTKVGHELREVIAEAPSDLLIGDEVSDLVSAEVEVVVDFSVPEATMGAARALLPDGVHLVSGTTGLPAGALEELGRLAGGEDGGNLVWAPNFALGAVLMMHFAATAARHYPAAEVIELHHAGKADAPSGTAMRTARAIAAALGAGERPGRGAESVAGVRGGEVDGVRVHSVRLPGLVAHQERTHRRPRTAAGAVVNGPTRQPAYWVEEFTPQQRARLEPYVTNLDGPVFALRNLPETVKAALFARYSRTGKSLRRLFLDEFADQAEAGAAAPSSATGTRRATELYGRIFDQYGDDSVAQLGGAHLACEQASNLLTKALEWGRLAAYLEQSTRYVSYSSRPGGRWRYHLDPEVAADPLGGEYRRVLDGLFETYAELLPALGEHLARVVPHEPGASEAAWRRALKARALDGLRGLLPAATTSNLGVFASGQAYEALLLRLRAHPLPEARSYADLILAELRKVIPTFLTRVDRPDRGGA